MRKTVLAAAALLTLGVGSAFAGEGDVNALPSANAQVAPGQAATVQTSTGQNRLFTGSTQGTTSVYSMFSRPGYVQGGEN